MPARSRASSGRTASGEVVTVDVLPEGSPAANPAFDVTPARLVTALITERGVCAASEAGLLSLYPEQIPGGVTVSPAARATAGLGFTQIVGWGTTFLMPSVLGRHIQDVARPRERDRVRRHHRDVRRGRVCWRRASAG